MKTIIFSDVLLEIANDCIFIDLLTVDDSEYSSSCNNTGRISLAPILVQFGSEWCKEFSDWLGKLNCLNAGLFWWAHTSTAKNLLSSPLGDRYLQIKAVCEIIKTTRAKNILIIGATPGQIDSIVSNFPESKFNIVKKVNWQKIWKYRLNNINVIFRLFFQNINIFWGFWWNRYPDAVKSTDIGLFTYIDGSKRVGFDNYFGELPKILSSNKDIFSINYLAYVYTPYHKRLRQIKNEKYPYIALFGLLKISDYIWSVLIASKEWWKNILATKSISGNNDIYEPLLREIFLHDIAVGGYLHNLLVYRAIRRYVDIFHPKTLIYPFENKSLEKMLIMGSKDGQFTSKIIGYQHTSVTPRHLTLLFEPDEAKYTPLPDKIVTVGKITRDYLEKNGNYPQGIFETGCALRQKWDKPFNRNESSSLPIRVLLALSSSKKELIESVKFFKTVKEYLPKLELGIRPHINFPISLMPDSIVSWLSINAIDLTNTLLEDNLEWCSVTVYVSSTVSLESLMRGKPIVNFSIGDVISPNPIIGKPSFYWNVNDVQEMVNTLVYIHEMEKDEYNKKSEEAIDYVNNYLAPIKASCLEHFI